MARRYLFLVAGVVLLSSAIAAGVTAAGPVYTEWSPPVNIGAPVNSAGPERGPAISEDGLSLYFDSDRTGGSGGRDIWVSHRATPGDPWGEPVNLGPTVNSSVDDYYPAFTPDGHWMFFNSGRPGGLGMNDIYQSYRADVHDDLGWEAPTNLGPPVNSAVNDNGPSYFENEGGAPQLFFGSGPRPGGLGDRDLYVSDRQADGSWGPPKWLGELSTLFNETRPTVRRDGLEIFFQRGVSPGAMVPTDVWVATRASVDDPWSAPVDLGAPVNVTNATQFRSTGEPYLAADAKTLFVNSTRLGGLGGIDLYVSSRSQVLPETKDDCKKDGWQRFGVFKNQGDCVSYVATDAGNPPG